MCTLLDAGPNYLVMELVEVRLRHRIKASKKVPIPLDEALVIARQIADALEAAHEKGIVHRDLKPGGVKIKPDGTVIPMSPFGMVLHHLLVPDIDAAADWYEKSIEQREPFAAI